MTNIRTLVGAEAIEYAAKHNLVLSRYTNVEAEKYEGLTVAEARIVPAKLIYLDSRVVRDNEQKLAAANTETWAERQVRLANNPPRRSAEKISRDELQQIYEDTGITVGDFEPDEL